MQAFSLGRNSFVDVTFALHRIKTKTTPVASRLELAQIRSTCQNPTSSCEAKRFWPKNQTTSFFPHHKLSSNKFQRKCVFRPLIFSCSRQMHSSISRPASLRYACTWASLAGPTLQLFTTLPTDPYFICL